MPELKLSCYCGKVQGKTDNVSSSLGTRLICCCNDCQAFAKYLGQENAVLDQYGGTDIFQMPVSYVGITEGREDIACVRLSFKGLYRWYTKCCNTPIGNTLGAGAPFLGLIHSIIDNAASRDKDLGKVRGYVYTKYAKKEIPEDQKGSALPILFRSIYKLISWKIKGLSKPSVFFDANGNPVSEPSVLD